MKTNIRNANPQEMDHIMSIYAIAKRFMEEHGNTEQWTGDDEVKREKLEELRTNGQLYVGEENGTIHFVFAYIQGADPTYSVIKEGAWLNDEPYGTIHRLASAGTSKGVVKMVSEWALEQNPNLRIDTHHDNIVMQNALARAGFTRCGIIYLENGDPRIAYQKTKENNMSKSLVTYFSASGITKSVAQKLANAKSADLFEIVPEKPYTDAELNWMNPLSRCNKEKFGKKDVPVAGMIANFAEYDTIYIGFPIWYYCAPNVINTFAKAYDWSGKKVYIFATSGGSGVGKTAEKLAPYLKGDCEIMDAKLFSAGVSVDELKAW